MYATSVLLFVHKSFTAGLFSAVIGTKQGKKNFLKNKMTQQEEFHKYLYLFIYESEYHKKVISECSVTLYKNVNLTF